MPSPCKTSPRIVTQRILKTISENNVPSSVSCGPHSRLNRQEGRGPDETEPRRHQHRPEDRDHLRREGPVAHPPEHRGGDGVGAPVDHEHHPHHHRRQTEGAQMRLEGRLQEPDRHARHDYAASRQQDAGNLEGLVDRSWKRKSVGTVVAGGEAGTYVLWPCRRRPRGAEGRFP